jgi:hypothetical protein
MKDLNRIQMLKVKGGDDIINPPVPPPPPR